MMAHTKNLVYQMNQCFSYFLYQKLNGGRNGHFMQFNCCWYRLWIFYVCPRFLIAAHDLRWHVRDTNNIAFSVLHVWICMRLSIQNCLFETYKTTCVSSEETNQTYNLLNIWFDWCFSYYKKGQHTVR